MALGSAGLAVLGMLILAMMLVGVLYLILTLVARWRRPDDPADKHDWTTDDDGNPW